MRQVTWFAAAFTVVLSLGFQAQAQSIPTLTLSTDAPDPMNILVGDEFTVFATLGNLGGLELIDLTSTVELPLSLVSIPYNLAAGPIVPDLGNMTLNFLAVLDSVDGQYSDFFGDDPITDGGVFYSFTMTAQNVGSGQFAFDPFSLFGLTVSFDPVDIDGGDPLQIRVVAPQTEGPDAAVVPEPATAGLALIGLAGLLGRARRRR
jgi:MYXO-CTERM domain-containing protein